MAQILKFSTKVRECPTLHTLVIHNPIKNVYHTFVHPSKASALHDAALWFTSHPYYTIEIWSGGHEHGSYSVNQLEHPFKNYEPLNKEGEIHD